MTDQQKVAIVFTGRQGAGKTVLSQALKNALQAAGLAVSQSTGRNDEDTLIVETTHDQRCYLSTGSQVSLDTAATRAEGMEPVGTDDISTQRRARLAAEAVCSPRVGHPALPEGYSVRPIGEGWFQAVSPEGALSAQSPSAADAASLCWEHKNTGENPTGLSDDELDGSALAGEPGYEKQTFAAIHSVIAQHEDPEAPPLAADVALRAIAELTQKFLPEQDVRTQEALQKAVGDFAKASGKTVVVLLDDEAQRWVESQPTAKVKPARVDPEGNPNRRGYVSKMPSGDYWPVQSDDTILPPSHLEAYRCGMAGGLVALCGLTHAASKNAGWYTNPATGEPLERNVPEMMMLIVSEIGEAMEGYRKGLMDDHLADRLSVEVELADAVIRIGDLCGYLGLDLAGAVIEKMAYNRNREDHKLEVRAKGGKAF